jgi:hypothetical protein
MLSLLLWIHLLHRRCQRFEERTVVASVPLVRPALPAVIDVIVCFHDSYAVMQEILLEMLRPKSPSERVKITEATSRHEGMPVVIIIVRG